MREDTFYFYIFYFLTSTAEMATTAPTINFLSMHSSPLNLDIFV